MKIRLSNRRTFLQQASSGMLAAAWGTSAFAGETRPFPTRPFGARKERVSLLGLGGYHLGAIQEEQDAIRLIQEAIDMGVTFIDNAWEYHNGRSEEIVGKALQGSYRGKAFVMTKHHGRDKKTAMTHLEDSLRRLQVETIDLWQFHEIVYDTDADMIFANEGGIEAAEEAKRSGKVRYVGFTGHKHPKFLLKMLDHDYRWDAVQMPLNAFDVHYNSFEQNVLPILLERRIAVLAMKTLGSGQLLQSGVVTAEEALRYAMCLPVTTVISGITSSEELHANAAVARTLKPMTMAEREALLQKTKEVAQTGKFEPFKSTDAYDGPIGRKLHGLG